MTADASSLRDRAIAAATAGDLEAAGALFDQAVAAAPADASILNSAGSHWSRAGNRARAMELFTQAVDIDPDAIEPTLNLAILATSGGRPGLALKLLVPKEKELANSSRYWSVRAAAERAAGARRQSYASFARAAESGRPTPRALEGRARMALETGLDARDHYRAAFAAAPNEPTVLLGYGQALECAGDLTGALEIAQELTGSLPGWVDALEWLAQLRWAAGDRENFADHYESAATQANAPEIYLSWCRMLAGVDRYAQAAEVAARGRKRLGESPELALLEAIHSGEAGDDDRAEAIFESLRLDTVDRLVHETRHRLRTGSPDRAERLAADAIAVEPGNVAAWALRDIAWRLLEDSRHDWLHCQPGLVTPVSLGLTEEEIETSVRYLDQLHDGSSMPVGQSVRDGSQTRGGLFDRHEPEARTIEQAIRRAFEDYRAGLPPPDKAHPLLRHRDSPWRVAGSWSIRVFSGGRHTEHIHTRGLVSSAAYFAVPPADPADPHAGWLELGRPPPDLRLDLPPIRSIEPVPGTCAFFPSTLYHGTRRFSAGKRMTVAIDIHLDDSE